MYCNSLCMCKYSDHKGGLLNHNSIYVCMCNVLATTYYNLLYVAYLTQLSAFEMPMLAIPQLGMLLHTSDDYSPVT